MQSGDRINVQLTAAEWNVVLTLLAENPYKVVAPIIGQIQQQAMEQEALRAPAAQGVSMTLNGHDLGEAKPPQ